MSYSGEPTDREDSRPDPDESPSPRPRPSRPPRPESNDLTPRRRPSSSSSSRPPADRPISRPDYSRAQDFGGYRDRSRASSRASGYTSGYTRPPYDEGYGAGGPGSGGTKGTNWPTNLTIIIVVALFAFFGGFIFRNAYDDIGGYDDERLVQAREIPLQFRDFCITYNGYPSFTVIEMTSVSTLTMASVPMLKLDSCTIPVEQTANALQALGFRRRAETIGPQLGGSNLTLIYLPVADLIAERLVNRFPDNDRDDIQTVINEVLGGRLDGLDLQNLVRTNLDGVYAMVPGHSFVLQPNRVPGNRNEPGLEQ